MAAMVDYGNTDFALIRLREHCAMVLESEGVLPTGTLMAARLFLDLDDALCGGRTLPLDWTDARRSLVLNGCPTMPSFLRHDEPEEPMLEV